MRGFFEYIKTKIITELPQYKTVFYYNSNNITLERLKEGRMLFPAVFVEFVFNSVTQLSMGIKDMDMTVRFRFMFESYTYDRLSDLDAMTEFTNYFDLWTGKEDDEFQFTPFYERFREIDSNHDMITLPIIEYQTNYRNTENYIYKTGILSDVITPSVRGEIVSSNLPVDDIVVFQENTFEDLIFEK